MKHNTIYHTVFVILLLTGGFATQQLLAQDGFRLKRTKKESTPINAQVYAGYNGLSDPADIIQDFYEQSNLTSLGGVAMGLQGMFELDTLLTQVWLGADVSYYRMAKRWLMDDPEVHYAGETARVDAVERLWGMGANLIVAIGPVWRITLMFGPGAQYQDAQVDSDLQIEGNLYEDRVIATALGAANFQLLTYEHGSIDANFRGLWGFGDYGSFQFQSLLGFTFKF
jgi:hypothetical protein